MKITIAPAELLRLRALARRLSRDASAAEDLLQDALIVAIRTGRLGEVGASNWMAGVMRNLALTTARAETRRRRREAIFVETCADGGAAESLPVPPQFIDSLPPSLRSVALLAAAGATRAEIGHLLGLADTALRQRLAALRKRWRARGEQDFAAAPDLAGRLELGSIRRALLPLARRTRFLLASHDPDGHPSSCSENFRLDLTFRHPAATRSVNTATGVRHAWTTAHHQHLLLCHRHRPYRALLARRRRPGRAADG